MRRAAERKSEKENGRGGRGACGFRCRGGTHDGTAKELKPPGASQGAGGGGGRRAEGRQEPYGSLETVRRKRAAGRDGTRTK